MPALSAPQFIMELTALQTKSALLNVQLFFRDEGMESKFLGIKMSQLFALAKQYMLMPLNEIAVLLDSEFYEARMGAVCMMDFQARDKKTSVEVRKELFDLYIAKHRQINNWDMVDRAAPYVVGGYLYDKPRTVLYKLAQSDNVWERRTAIVSTYFFIRKGDVNDTFQIAAILISDKHDLIQKAAGSWIREAGKKDKPQLIRFLDSHAATMPRKMLRYAIEKLDKETREYYMHLNPATAGRHR